MFSLLSFRQNISQSSSGPNKQQPILDIDLDTALWGLELTFEQFVDLCLLCGYENCNTTKDVGPKTALKLIHQFKDIESVVRHVQREKKCMLSKELVCCKVKKGEREPEEEKQAESEIVSTASSPTTPAVSTSNAAISVDNVALRHSCCQYRCRRLHDDLPLGEEDEDEALVDEGEEEETDAGQVENPGEGFE